jgi:hypothetical protein
VHFNSPHSMFYNISAMPARTRSVIAIIIALSVCASAGAFASETDTKYICSFMYQRPGFLGSAFQMSSDVRFDRGVSRLYYFGLRTGYHFYPFSWFEFGTYYRFEDQIGVDNKWAAENSVEFELIPKIILSFLEPQELRDIAGSAGISAEAFMNELEHDDIVTAAGKRALRFVIVDLRSEMEYRDLNLMDTSRINPVLRLHPRASWLYDFGTFYLADEALYTFKYHEWFSNWVRLGVIRPFYALRLDMFYVYESLRPVPAMPEWAHANIFGTSFSYIVE